MYPRYPPFQTSKYATENDTVASVPRYGDPLCLLVRSLVHSFVNIKPTATLAGRQPAGWRRAINIAVALRATGGGFKHYERFSSCNVYHDGTI